MTRWYIKGSRCGAVSVFGAAMLVLLGCAGSGVSEPGDDGGNGGSRGGAGGGASMGAKGGAGGGAGGTPSGMTGGTSGGSGSGGTSGAGATAGGTTSTEKPPVLGSDGQALVARLGRLNEADAFLFGQQNATLWGVYRNGQVIATNAWFDATAKAGAWTSDGAAVVGDDPAVLGVSIEMLAFEPTSWNRRQQVGEAIRRQIERGGVVTLDWHAPSCEANVRTEGTLGSVRVGDRDVTIHAIPGGTSFYAEEEYGKAINARADVPEAVTCLCKIANDQALTKGPYAGLRGKAWLVAHAKHTARVLREQGLGGKPLIVRPFHEHNGSWFWWGQPYWNCGALLGGEAGKVSGPAAYTTVFRTFAAALRSEEGMQNVLFAYSSDKLLAPTFREDVSPSEKKIVDPPAFARDLLRARLVTELGKLNLAFVSPAQTAATLDAATVSAAQEAAYVDQLRAYYREAYPGDDVIDLLGIDLYYPIARGANASDLRRFRFHLRALGEEARARRKPYALTETGTYRMRLVELVSKLGNAAALPLNARTVFDEGWNRLFAEADRTSFLSHFGLMSPAAVALSSAEVTALFGANPSAYQEKWYTTQLLAMAKEAKVAYALVWQTYLDASWTDRYYYYYVPYPGHPEAADFKTFFDDPATCFLKDACK